jgi:methyl-accepting chemotaxis protein-2 (aspartate sensor receptor)
MDSTIQQNAAMVHESSAAANSLEDEAARLSQLVSVFRLLAQDEPQTSGHTAMLASRLRRPEIANRQAALPGSNTTPGNSAIADTSADNWTTF